MIKKVRLTSLILSVLFLMCSVTADLLPLQGTVYNGSGSPVNNGDLQVLIYSSSSGGTLVYNSSTDFDSSINNGEYDVLLGSGTVTLQLEFGKVYYMDILINSEDIDFNGNERQIFQSTVGEIKKLSSNNIATGDYSFVGGEDSTASGEYSFVFGESSLSEIDDGIVLGGFNHLYNGLLAFGRFNIINSSLSSVIGLGNTIDGDKNQAFGYVNDIDGNLNSALGNNIKINGTGSGGLGNNIGIFGNSSFAIGRYIGIYGDNSIGFNLNSDFINITQDNTFAIVGGNSGFNITTPQRTVHISDTLRIEPRSSAPSSPALGDLYVDSDSNELCFYDGSSWTGLKSAGSCS